MSAAATNLADTASLLTEVTNVFNPEEDLTVLNKFVETSAETTRGAEEKQAEIKQIVRGARPTSYPRRAAPLPRPRPRPLLPAVREGAGRWCRALTGRRARRVHAERGAAGGGGQLRRRFDRAAEAPDQGGEGVCERVHHPDGGRVRGARGADERGTQGYDGGGRAAHRLRGAAGHQHP